MWWLPFACTATEPVEPSIVVTVEDVAQVVPSPGLPPEAAPNHANNNLDIARFDGRLFLAFRTADTHFAGPEVRMVVVSSVDEVSWRYEGEVALGTDVREPQLVVIDGELRLYFTHLGDDSLDFEPGGVRMIRYQGPGAWTEPVDVFDAGYLAWRIKWMDGRLYAFGYSGGENVYDDDGEPVIIEWLASEDGSAWSAAFGDDPVVLSGGGSESDGVWLDDGRLVAVVRNEAGDESGFGSKICTAPADDPMAWDCAYDPRKYDSPLVIHELGAVWLVARRNVSDTGWYDLGRDDLPAAQQYGSYQLDYWQRPKRCALWRVDPDRREVSWVFDLPSNGDTCFPEAEPLGDGVWLLYNYSNDPDGPELTWIEGQTGDTNIYRQILRFREVTAIR
ncbi:MAG TPA: hypothetical protein PKA64_02120 [Myxococcota bacterium]|nr:hypothetical protein [Myxococcota bacterium]